MRVLDVAGPVTVSQNIHALRPVSSQAEDAKPVTGASAKKKESGSSQQSHVAFQLPDKGEAWHLGLGPIADTPLAARMRLNVTMSFLTSV